MTKSPGFKSRKREYREGAFIIYFESLLRDDDIDEIYQSNTEAEDIGVEISISKSSCALAKSVSEKSDELDRIIEKYSSKRSVSRISKINLAILRIALYEMVYQENVPPNVAISEAVELAEKYALKPDVAFINGVLGAYLRAKTDSGDIIQKESLQDE